MVLVGIGTLIFSRHNGRDSEQVQSNEHAGLTIIQSIQDVNPGMVWLDDENLVVAKDSLYTVNVVSDSIEKLEDNPSAKSVLSLCPGGKSILYRESTGHYKLFDLNTKTSSDILGKYKHALDAYSCKVTEIPAVLWEAYVDNRVLPLRHDGYVLFELIGGSNSASAAKEYNVFFVSSDGTTRTPIDIGSKNFHLIPSVSWVPYKKAYFMRNEVNEGPERPFRKKLVQLSPAGTVIPLTIPSDIYDKGTSGSLSGGEDREIVPVKTGTLVSFNDIKDYKRSAYKLGSGLYFVNSNGASERIVAGFVGNIAVSPNGCNVALRFAESIGYSAYAHFLENASVGIVNVCE